MIRFLASFIWKWRSLSHIPVKPEYCTLVNHRWKNPLRNSRTYREARTNNLHWLSHSLVRAIIRIKLTTDNVQYSQNLLTIPIQKFSWRILTTTPLESPSEYWSQPLKPPDSIKSNQWGFRENVSITWLNLDWANSRFVIVNIEKHTHTYPILKTS